MNRTARRVLVAAVALAVMAPLFQPREAEARRAFSAVANVARSAVSAVSNAASAAARAAADAARRAAEAAAEAGRRAAAAAAEAARRAAAAAAEAAKRAAAAAAEKARQVAEATRRAAEAAAEATRRAAAAAAEATRRAAAAAAEAAKQAAAKAAAAAAATAQAIKDQAAKAAAAAAAAAKAVGNTVAQAATTVANNVGPAIVKGLETVKTAAVTAGAAVVKGVEWIGDKVKEGLEKLKELLKKVGELTAELARYTTGEIPNLVRAFQGGPAGLVVYVVKKLPGDLLGKLGPAGQLIDGLFSSKDIFEMVTKIAGAFKTLMEGLANGAKSLLKAGIDGVIKPLVTKVATFVSDTVFKPVWSAVGPFLQPLVDTIVPEVASAILGRSEWARQNADAMTEAMNAVAAGDLSVFNSKLAAYNTSVETLGKDLPNIALEYGLGWIRGKVVGFVLAKIQNLMKQVWGWAYKGVSAARNAVQGAVGSVPFVGGALAVALGMLLDEAWGILKSSVEAQVEEQVNRIADFATGAAKDVLSGAAAKAGGAIQALVDGIRPVLQTVAQKVKVIVDPYLAKYRSVVERLQKLSGAGAAGSK